MSKFDEMYASTPPWDIGRPQPTFVDLAQRGNIHGSVLDVGCGTGENALYLASLGHEVWGVDIVPAPIEKARASAKHRGLNVTFKVFDALSLNRLGRMFDTVIDSGLFHVFSDEDRVLFERSLASILRPDGWYFMLCFSEHEPYDEGPRRVTADEIRGSFRERWKVDDIQEARFETNIHPDGALAWLASIRRLERR